ncbi:MAG TPA: conjugal transfer protein TraF [bacterium]|nr:conjugal transfer protein TraF [bacterium]
MKEREILKIPDVQFGFHYSIYALDNIEEYNNINNQPIFGGYTNDEESLFLFNMNMPVNIINNDIRAGANLKFYRHSLSSFNINSSALDLGIKTTFNKFNLGLSLKNLISKDFRYYQKKYNLPKQYIIGTSYNFEILPNINFILNNDYTINTQNTDNNLAFGFDVQFNSIIQNSKINFLYGIDKLGQKFVRHPWPC